VAESVEYKSYKHGFEAFYKQGKQEVNSFRQAPVPDKSKEAIK